MCVRLSDGKRDLSLCEWIRWVFRSFFRRFCVFFTFPFDFFLFLPKCREIGKINSFIHCYLFICFFFAAEGCVFLLYHPDELFAFSIIRYHLFLSVVKRKRFYHVPINRLVRSQNQCHILSTSTRKRFNVCIFLLFPSLTLRVYLYTFSIYVYKNNRHATGFVAFECFDLGSCWPIRWAELNQNVDFIVLPMSKCFLHYGTKPSTIFLHCSSYFDTSAVIHIMRHCKHSTTEWKITLFVIFFC